MLYLAIFCGLLLLRIGVDRGLCSDTLAYWFTLVSLFLFSAFRFEVGCDWTGYINQYEAYQNFTDQGLWTRVEPFWIGLFHLQYWFDLPYPWINVFSSALFFAGVHVMARRQPDAFSFLLLLFPILIINMPMSGIRQGAAIGIMFIAFMAFVDRSLIRFVLFTIAAAGLHSSAIVFLMLAPLVTGEYSLRRVGIAVFLAIPGAVLMVGGDAVEVASDRYINSGLDAAGAIFRVGVLGLTAAYFIYFLRRSWDAVFPVDFKLVMLGSLIMIGSFALLPISSVIADRLAYYLIPIQVVILARIPYFSWPVNYSIHVAFPYVLLLIVFVVWISFSSLFHQCYLPYQSWLLGYPEQTRGFFDI